MWNIYVYIIYIVDIVWMIVYIGYISIVFSKVAFLKFKSEHLFGAVSYGVS